jgi:hypothetical protein
MIKVATMTQDPSLTYKVSCEYQGEPPFDKSSNHPTVSAAEDAIDGLIENIPGSPTEACGRTYHIHDSNGVWIKSVEASPNRF